MAEDISNDDVMGQMLFEKAKAEFPYLKDKDVAFAYTPIPDESRFLEFYSPEETKRPKYLPAGKVGIEVFSPKVRPIDILGDYVSHYGVQNDPELAKLYSGFKQTVPDTTMRERYAYHQQKLGEKRPYEDWLEISGMPEYFRGYTFNQWGENAKQMYTPEQLQYLDKIRQYLGIK